MPDAPPPRPARSSHVAETVFLDRLHGDIGRGGGDMRQGRDMLRQNAPVIAHVLRPDLQQVIEIACDQMRLLDLGDAGDGGVEDAAVTDRDGERGLRASDVLQFLREVVN